MTQDDACQHGTEGAQRDPRICSACSAPYIAHVRRRAQPTAIDRIRRDLADLGVQVTGVSLLIAAPGGGWGTVPVRAEIEGGAFDPELVEARHRAWLRDTRVQAALHVAATRKMLRER